METQKKSLSNRFKDSFYLFKFGAKNRPFAQEPKNVKTWLIHALSEFIGTIFILLGLAGLSTYVNGHAVIEEYLGHLIIVGFFAGFVIVGLCLFIFLRWSCDLNPAVTLTRWLNGTNTTRYALMKFVMQFLGALVAAAIIYAAGTSAAKHGLHNEPIQALKAASKDLLGKQNDASLIDGSLWIFFIELIMTAILLFPIFSPNIRDEYRDLLIMFIISLDVWMGILGGTAAINPARGLAQQLPSLIFQQKELATNNLTLSVQYGTIAMVLGSWLSPFLYLSVAGFTREFVNPWVVGIIKFKNTRSENMTTPNQK
ncbi:hypothetical protein C4M97_03245 [Mycoplasmopsis pullorum]|uniref:aquaporin n=1 Tax=Mycoplasmopsis pullorum TaxID=48003 RepID=UPI001119312A|nr:aquaporin [Mycoplasmopsis pullorum]TNK82035.1 hypothetical protein C4M94_02305 [Mycoplasmopsis pullorum]TNK83117.1 hypothetical protein C4M80_01425 [Mycoplasmopsis pullorum]TNK84324.1 hypothetical protein C4M81_02650 [Mycoplasmopsis pullorum]TNK84913.1 hypothetical protein C4M85_03590 [Mycoplasmopsis pullorum]TNK85125.1 hypothetical protein C4M92_02345 [Mycoplasmopsis pullorum]